MSERGFNYDTHSGWRSAPERAFDEFVRSLEFVKVSRRRPRGIDVQGNPKELQPLRPSSVETYNHMWARFTRWLRTKGCTAFDLSKEDLQTFLELRDDDGRRQLASATIRRQYLTLFERVFQHLKCDPNPAARLCVDMSQADNKQMRGKNAPTSVLTAEQQALFFASLLGAPPSPSVPTDGWRVRRDRALQAVMLGAGLKVSEAIRLATSDIQIDEEDMFGNVPVLVRPPVSVSSTVQEHRALLRPPAAAIVLAWVDERETLGLAGALLFPATKKGGCLEKSVVYRKTKATYELAGLPVLRKGGRTLRNTYAVGELLTGQPAGVLKEFLGHRSDRAMETYTAVVAKVNMAQGASSQDSPNIGSFVPPTPLSSTSGNGEE